MSSSLLHKLTSILLQKMTSSSLQKMTSSLFRTWCHDYCRKWRQHWSRKWCRNYCLKRGHHSSLLQKITSLSLLKMTSTYNNNNNNNNLYWIKRTQIKMKKLYNKISCCLTSRIKKNMNNLTSETSPYLSLSSIFVNCQNLTFSYDY